MWTPKRIFILIIVVFLIIVGVIAYVQISKAVAKGKEASDLAGQLGTDAALRKAITAKTGITDDRVQAIQQNAHTIYSQMQGWSPINSDSIGSMLNSLQSDDEMKALNDYYNTNLIKDGHTTLKLDLLSRVVSDNTVNLSSVLTLGGIKWIKSTDIRYWNDLT